jgi:hypothetical protein
MSETAIRVRHSRRPITEAAWDCFHKRGYLFPGAPPLADYMPLEVLHAIAACIGRQLDEREMRHLVRVERSGVIVMAGKRRFMKILLAIFPERMEKLLQKDGVLKCVNHKHVLWSAAFIPMGKFNEDALYERVTKDQSKEGSANGHAKEQTRGDKFNNRSTVKSKNRPGVLVALDRQTSKAALRQMRHCRPIGLNGSSHHKQRGRGGA